jgi:hypothetical protein
MPRQLQLTLIAIDYEQIAAASDLQPALAEMLRAYFQHMLSQEDSRDRQDHAKP